MGKSRVGYHRKTAVASAAMTELSTRSGRSVLSLAVEACAEALARAGICKEDVDGVASFSIYGDSVPAESVGAALGLKELSYVMDFNQGGQSAAYMVMHAAMAVHAGLAKAVLVFRALNGRSGMRVGWEKAAGVGPDLRYRPGLDSYPQVLAIWTSRYMHETGATEDDLAVAAINARLNGARNPRALRKAPLSTEDYFRSPYVAKPFRRVDCTIEVDGAAAVLVTSIERARDLNLPPAVVSGSGWLTRGFDLDMAGMLCYDQPSRNYAHHLKDRLYGEAGLAPADIQSVALYDCFTGVLLQNLEGFGFAEPGGGGDFVRAVMRGERGPVVNPSGGLLAEGYLHGMNLLADAVWQVQGLAGETQVPGCVNALCCSGGSMSGSAIILSADRK
jgi:acetyl-CoA acetyltransferase